MMYKSVLCPQSKHCVQLWSSHLQEKKKFKRKSLREKQWGQPKLWNKLSTRHGWAWKKRQCRAEMRSTEYWVAWLGQQSTVIKASLSLPVRILAEGLYACKSFTYYLGETGWGFEREIHWGSWGNKPHLVQETLTLKEIGRLEER